jgi:hypothetical protein
MRGRGTALTALPARNTSAPIMPGDLKIVTKLQIDNLDPWHVRPSTIDR